MSKKTLRSLTLEVIDQESDIDFLREIAEKTNKKLKVLDPPSPSIIFGSHCYSTDPCQHEIFVDHKSQGSWDGKRIAKWYKDHLIPIPDHFKEYE
jgi:hypothetical protein